MSGAYQPVNLSGSAQISKVVGGILVVWKISLSMLRTMSCGVQGTMLLFSMYSGYWNVLLPWLEPPDCPKTNYLIWIGRSWEDVSSACCGRYYGTRKHCLIVVAIFHGLFFISRILLLNNCCIWTHSVNSETHANTLLGLPWQQSLRRCHMYFFFCPSNHVGSVSNGCKQLEQLECGINVLLTYRHI